MAGAIPNTSWLDGCIVLDDKGFVKTGADLSSDDLTTAKWPLARAPYLLETSRPGIFAVGDVRGGKSSEWRLRSAKGRLRSRLFIRCSARKAPARQASSAEYHTRKSPQ